MRPLERDLATAQEKLWDGATGTREGVTAFKSDWAANTGDHSPAVAQWRDAIGADHVLFSDAIRKAYAQTTLPKSMHSLASCVQLALKKCRQSSGSRPSITAQFIRSAAERTGDMVLLVPLRMGKSSSIYRVWTASSKSMTNLRTP